MCRYCDDEDGKKAMVAFVVGLLIGGMLLWAFTGPSPEVSNDDSTINKQAFDACLSAGGIPIVAPSGRLEACQTMKD